jgi:cytoskeletal protein CcmA (bactofilin family)
MAQQYGTVKCDVLTFTSGTTGNETDVSVAVSGLLTTSADITVTGDIQGRNITATGDLNVSGTGLIESGVTIGGGLTVSGTGSTYASGLTVNGTLTAGTVVTSADVTVTGNLTVTGTISGDVIKGGTLVSGTTANFASGVFTSQISGATVTGTTANFASGVFTSQISGATVTGNTGNFTSITATTANITSGVFASGAVTAPSVSVGTTNNGIYSPSTNQIAVATSGTGRLFVDDEGNVGIGTSSPSSQLHVVGNINTDGSLVFEGTTADDFETTLSATDPTADRAITLPDSSTALAGLAVTQSFTKAQRGSSVTLTSSATITPDFAEGNNFDLTLGVTATLANPTNLAVGQSGAIVITNGAFQLSYGSYYKFPGGTTPTITQNAVSVIVYYVESATRITAQALLDVS